MPDQTPAQSPTPAETTPTPETPSLEQIAREFNVEEQANQFAAKPPVQQYAPQPNIPDPVLDPDGYRRFMAQQTQSSSELQRMLNEIRGEIGSLRSEREKERLDADINRAVSKVNEKLKVEPLMAEIALEMEYRTNQTFKTIWDNRDRNPEAFNKALDILAQKLAPKFALRQDPQLTENQRAAQSSQRTMGTQAPQPNEAMDILQKNPADFDRWWQETKLRGN